MISRRWFLAGIAGSSVALASGVTPVAAATASDVEAYRNPGCGCCEKWAEAMTAAGFRVSMTDDADLAARREKVGVPPDLAGCHLAIVGGYIIEGHVPPKEVVRLLSEKPDARGLSVPGMPVGSPGMEADGAADKYDVLLFTAKGERKVFASY
jgi:hypothetical protein